MSVIFDLHNKIEECIFLLEKIDWKNTTFIKIELYRLLEFIEFLFNDELLEERKKWYFFEGDVND